MKEQLERIKSFMDKLQPGLRDFLNSISVTVQYEKGEFLLQQDEICRHSYWIIKGIVRKYHLSDGKEHTTELLFEDDIAVSLQSYTLQKRSTEFIQAISDTTVSKTNYTTFQKAKNDFPELLQLDLLLTEYHAMWLEKRLSDSRTLDATQRYLQLLQERPEMLWSVPLTYLASYLGVSLETLSRIRARI